MARDRNITLRRGTQEAWVANASGDGVNDGEIIYDTTRKGILVGDGSGFESLPSTKPAYNDHSTLYSAWSVTKDNDDVERKFPLSYINFVSNPSFDIIGYEWDSSSSSPTLTYIDSAGTPISAPDFDNHIIWGNIWRCCIDPATMEVTFGSNARGDGLDLTGASGDIFVRIPVFYVKKELDGVYKRVWISPIPATGFTKAPSFNQRNGTDSEIFIGAYEAYGYDDNGTFKLGSATGKQPVTGEVSYTDLPNSGRLNITDVETYSQNAGYSGGINLWSWVMLQDLLYVEYASYDLQTAIGKGVVDLAAGSGFAGLNTGANSSDTNIGTNGTGTGTGTNGQTPVVWRGIENPWGNCWKFLIGANLYLADGSVHVLNRDGTGTVAATLAAGSYETLTGTVPLSDGYIFGLLTGSDLDLATYFPSAVSGSSSTYLTDYWTYPRYNPSILRAGGYWADGLYAGPGFLTYYAPSASYRDVGARLEFIPRNTVSYSDDFSSDTSDRYQAVTGSVAYNTDHLEITTASGADGKGTARLKSYKFENGSQKYTTTLPTGADGDFICLVTHATNGAMSNGIGVGLQSDGATNWNLATLSGTTVTEGADSGFDDADSVTIEIEKDVTGVYNYYIYLSTSVRPTSPTGTLYTSLDYGYTGWYCNGAGATTQTFTVDYIECRAESIVGRTNVPVEEPFWFRDEFGENSLGRLTNPSVSGTTISGGVLTNTGTDWMIWNLPDLIDADTNIWRFEVTNNNSTAASVKLITKINYQNTTTHYEFRIYASTSTSIPNTVRLYKIVNSVETQIGTDASITFTTGTKYYVKITRTADGVFSFYMDAIDGSTLIKTYAADISLTRGKFALVGTGDTVIDNLQITGTRVYDKPIHRGAMLESYWDGSEEVVGTTFVDDCNWDRSAEWTDSQGTWSQDTTNGEIDVTLAVNSYAMRKINGFTSGDGWYSVNVRRNSTAVEASTNTGFILKWDGVIASSIPQNGYGVFLDIENNLVKATKYASGSTAIYSAAPIGATFADATWYTLSVLVCGTVLSIYINGVFQSAVEMTTSMSGRNIGFESSSTTSAECKFSFSNLVIVGDESTSINGISACISGVGGGARFDTIETAGLEFTNPVLFGRYHVIADGGLSTVTDSSATYLEYRLQNTTDTTGIVIGTSDVVFGQNLSTAYANYLEENVCFDRTDVDDTIVIRAERKAEATHNTPATYTNYISIVPVTEVYE